MTKKFADIRINITVEFDDDGVNELVDQAIEAAQDLIDADAGDFQVLGPVRDTLLIEQPK